MGIFDSIKDNFTNTNFEVEGTMTISDLSNRFLSAFGCALRVYKGAHIADGRMTINTLNEKSSAKINKDAGKLKIKATEKVGDVEDKFKAHFGLKVQVADKHNANLLPDTVTLGEGSRM